MFSFSPICDPQTPRFDVVVPPSPGPTRYHRTQWMDPHQAQPPPASPRRYGGPAAETGQAPRDTGEWCTACFWSDIATMLAPILQVGGCEVHGTAMAIHSRNSKAAAWGLQALRVGTPDGMRAATPWIAPPVLHMRMTVSLHRAPTTVQSTSDHRAHGQLQSVIQGHGSTVKLAAHPPNATPIA